MQWIRSGIATITILLALGGGASVSRAQALHFQLFDLGTLGGQTSQGFGINSGDVVVGSSLLNGDQDTHAFSDAAPGGPMTDLGTSGGQNSAAFGINAAGRVVGEAQDALSATRAAQWIGGVSADLGTLPGDATSSAKAINTAGTVVGVSTNSLSEQHAFLYDGNPDLTDLGTLDGSGGNTAAFGISDTGVVVGYSADLLGTRRAFQWDSIGGMTDLLGSAADGDAAAWGISGNFAYGQFTTTLGDTHAFRYDLSSAQMTDLGTLGSNSSVTLAGNAAGFAVGTSGDGFGDDLGFIYHPTLGMLTLNELLVSNPTGVTLTSAQGINSVGDIVAIGNFANGDTHAFFLRQVAAPEPATLALLLVAGGAGLFVSFHPHTRRRMG